MVDTTRMAAVVLTALFYALHQDFFFWRSARPLVFGMLPIGLFYHIAYTLASSAVLWMLVRAAWPAHLEEVEPVSPSSRRRSSDE